MRILLIEDEAALADVLARNLRARGNETVVVGSAEAALDEIERTLPDALVLDVNLPDKTGWDVLRRLSAAQRALVRVVVISAAPISSKRIDEFNPDVSLQKPFPIDALMRALNPAAPAAAARGGDEEA